MGRATNRMFPGVGPRFKYMWAICRSSAPVTITVAKTRTEARSRWARSGLSLGMSEQYAGFGSAGQARRDGPQRRAFFVPGLDGALRMMQRKVMPLRVVRILSS